MGKNRRWKFAVDRGGTFTDVIGVDPEGNYHSTKLLSQSSQYDDPSIEGIRRLLGTDKDEKLPQDLIERIRFGTTVATNALLERKGGGIALFITSGFEDLLEIGYQDRPDIFKLCIKKTPPLYISSTGVRERIDCNGNIIIPIDRDALMSEIDRMHAERVDAAAVVFMHSWKNPEHELQCEAVLKDSGVSNIVLSHRAVNQIKIVSRGQSTLVDAYLSVVIERYLDGIKKYTGRIPVEFMQSSGALTRPESFKGKNALLSGPAGGVVAVAEVSVEKKLQGAVGFDMGGTSTDVSRFDGEFQKKYEQVIDGIPLQVEMLDIVTVAAGGGSILDYDGQKMTAGPESAGSYPGPACYGFEGPLTVTDANLITGRLIPEYFPNTFGPDRNSPLDVNAAEQKFAIITDDINSGMNTTMTPRDAAEGFLRIANERMAMAIKEISVSRGFDIRDYALVCFGGAGGQHACSIAALLDIEKIIIHPLSSLMSAYGIGLSKPAQKKVQTVLRPYTRHTHEELIALYGEMEGSLYIEHGINGQEIGLRRELALRPRGADSYLTVKFSEYEETVRSFMNQYRRLFGFSHDNAELEAVSAGIEIEEKEDFLPAYAERYEGAVKVPEPESYREVYFSGEICRVPVYLRESIPDSFRIKGPAFIIDSNFTAVVEPGFEAETDSAGVITLTKSANSQKREEASSAKADPVLLEVFNNIFMGISTEMGHTLRNTAFSVNMKERLDFSCAIFDSCGGLVANAPHIPVHLGSMSDTVKAVIEDRAEGMKPGDVYLTNNPYRGGSHLPDMTVLCPVFADNGKLVFFTAARGHHADVGGSTPGSMPPSASHIDEEGVLLDSFLLLSNGKMREKELKEILLNHKYPARNISERLFDFRAQIAACHKGVRELERVIDRYGLPVVLDYMGHIQKNSEFSVRSALHRYIEGTGVFRSSFEDAMDDGTVIRVSVTVDGGINPPETLKAVIDFTGTGSQHIGDNLNAPVSVTRSAVLYVLRLMIDREIPLNSGCLAPVEIIVPKGSVLNPDFPAPVASGNVETSQRIVDVLLGAFGAAAASQGTMNNFLFEVEGESPYYETIAGGSGAMEGCPGASGVQVHMTNTRMTDPEILEVRHPGVRLDRFTLRKNSGGIGIFNGGEGVTREMLFLKPATVSIISERRIKPPYGLDGGGSGCTGRNVLKKASGETEELKHRDVLKVNKNEVIIIETPGGGGYGQK